MRSEKKYSYAWNDDYWMYANWRRVAQADYATNPTVYRYYRQDAVGLFRNQSFEKIFGRIANGDTVRVAVDYYGLMPSVCKLPIALIERFGARLSAGEVIVFKIYLYNNYGLAWEEIK